MTSPLITIGIPTWNRCRYLKKNIQLLVAEIQSSQLEQTVEVLVSDNASTDETEQYCLSMADQYPFLRYQRQPQNRGANANFQFVIEDANGAYVWLLGDDDLLVKGAIANVMADIKLSPSDVLVGPAVFDQTQEKATHRAYDQKVLTNRNIFSHEDVIALAGKISGLIFKKSSVLPYVTQAQPLICATRTPWPHLAWLLLMLNDPTKNLLILPYGINQLVADHWHNLLFDGKTLLTILILEYQTLLQALKSDITPSFYQTLLNRSVSSRQATLLKCVLYGTYLDGYWQMLGVASKAWWRVVGFKNRLNYLVFLLVPLVIPSTIRRMGYQLASLCWPKLRLTIERIERAKVMMMAQAAIDCRQYNEQQL